MDTSRDCPRSTVRLSKAELLRRLDARSRERYGGPFSEGLLNDLIKDGLVPALKRSKNEGLKPQYEASALHYRRALQIKRLISIGMSSRDTQRIQLFLRGYGVKPWDVREALRREYAKHLRTLSTQIRSTYLDNDKNIGERHKVSLRKQMGPLDNRLKASGLEMPTDFYIKIGRSAKAPDGDSDDPLVGQLLIDPGSSTLSNQIEKALDQPDEKFVQARAAFHWVDRHVMQRILGVRILNDSNYATIVLVEMLCCVRSFSFKSISRVPWDFVRNFLHSIAHGQPKVRV
jgi:hypothetical protein